LLWRYRWAGPSTRCWRDRGSVVTASSETGTGDLAHILLHCEFVANTELQTRVLWNSLPSDLYTSRCSSRHFSTLNSPARIWSFKVFFFYRSIALKSIVQLLLSYMLIRSSKHIPSPFISSLVYIHLSYLRTELSGIDWAFCSFISHHFSLSFSSCCSSRYFFDNIKLSFRVCVFLF